MSFAVEDVFVSAIFSVACDVLAEIGEDYKRPHADVQATCTHGRERFRTGVVETSDERTGAARDYDVRADKWVATETVAQFAPLLCGGLPHAKERALLRLLEGPRFCGHPDLKYALIPSTSPVSRDFRSREYWRGPVWPVMTWLFSWCFARRGWAERALMLKREGLGRPATAPSPSITSRSPANRWAACSSRGPPQRCWTGSVDPAYSARRSSGASALVSVSRSSSLSFASSAASCARRAASASRC